MVGAATEFGFLFIRDAERNQRRVLEVKRKARFRRGGRFLDQAFRNADYLQRALLQVVRLLGIQRQNLARNLTFRKD